MNGAEVNEIGETDQTEWSKAIKARESDGAAIHAGVKITPDGYA